MRRALPLWLCLPLVLGDCQCNQEDPPPPPPPPCDHRKTCGAGDCGEQLDTCGGILRCPSCPAGETCGGEGTPNRCGVGTCSPKTCLELGKNCDLTSDGCSKLLDCGRCTRPNDCGVAVAGVATPNFCGGPSCVRKTCNGKCEWSEPDGCGGTLVCSSGCVAPATCGGGGVPNACGCTGKTCAELLKNCGRTDDTCGRQLDCGGCDPDAGTCGGGGYLNVCGRCDEAKGRVCTSDCWCWDTPRPTAAGVAAFVGTGPDDLWLLAGGSSFVHRTAGGLAGHASASTTVPRSGWALAPDDIWVVTGDVAAQLVHWDGANWRAQFTGPSSALTAVWGSASDALWVVGNDGTILFGPDASGDGGFTNVTPGSGSWNDVWGAGKDDVWFAGSALLHWNGVSFDPPLNGFTTFDVHGTASDDVWAAGTSGLRHWNGSAWTVLYSPTGHQVTRVWAIGRDDVWVGNTRGVLAHKGTGSSFVDLQLDTLSDISALWASGPDDVWVSAGLRLFHKDSRGWSDVTSLPSADLSAVYAASETDVWLAGAQGRVLHGDGTQWRQLMPAGTTALAALGGAGDRVWLGGANGVILSGTDGGLLPETSNTLQNVTGLWAVSPTEAYASTVNGLVFETDGGGTWSALSVSGLGGVNAVFATRRDDVWLGGGAGRMGHFTGGGWFIASSGTVWPIRAFWGAGGELFAAAGERPPIVTNGAVLRYVDGGWVDLSAASGVGYYGAWGRSPSEVYFAGTRGTVKRWNGAQLDDVPAATVNDLYSIGGGATGPVWAAGFGGVVVRIDSPAQSARVPPVPLTPDDDLAGVFGFGPDDLWAVGSAGTPHHYDGTKWETWQAPNARVSTAGLLAVWGASKNDIWATGKSGHMVHFDGGSWAAVPSGAISGNDLTGLWGSATNDVWAVGDAMMGHWNGTTWAKVGFGAGGQYLSSVYGTARDDVWAVGAELRHFDGMSWSLTTNPSPGSTYNSVHCSARDDCWATGLRGGGIGQAFGVVARWDGSKWTEVQNFEPNPRVVWARGPFDMFVFHLNGIVSHWDGIALHRQVSGTDKGVLSAWGDDAGVWAVTPRGVMFRSR